jgi:hypothetical protein
MPYFEGVGFQDSKTSYEAAVSIADCAPTMEQKVLDAVHAAGTAGMTNEEVVDQIGMRLSSVCGRMNALWEKGKVIRTGMERPGASGRNHVVNHHPDFVRD